ncbi:MAG: hypothetical protein PHZ04_02875 [Patescibacteria group bacterium]|nr:hypothetical protein [Patescibacteria group bacterium]
MGKKKILIVHGYEFWNDHIGELNKTICQTVAKIHGQYDIIVMSCGWYFSSYPWRPTIAEVIKDRLIELGVPAEKLHTQFSLGKDNLFPPRDIMEDVDFLATLLKSLGFTPRETEFDAIVIWFMKPRVKFLQRTRRTKCQKIIGAWSGFKFNKDTIRKILTEPLAFLIMLFDPWGRGKIIARTRRQRTCQVPDFVTEKNLPSAWE